GHTPQLSASVQERQRRLFAALDRFAVEGIVRALGADSWRTNDRIDVDALMLHLEFLPRHRRLVGRMCDILVEEGMLAHDGSKWQVVRPPAKTDPLADFDSSAASAIEWQLLTRCCGQLRDV